MSTYKSVPVNAIQLLTLLFIGLKLSGHIEWNWWLVLCPFLIQGFILGCLKTFSKVKDTE